MPQTRTPVLPAALLLLTLGCTAPTPTPSTAGPPATSPAADAAAQVAAATALVRAGASAAKPVASGLITANDRQLKGGTLHVFSVRATDASTRLEWVITHPTTTLGAVALIGLAGIANDPYLVAGGKEYRMTQFKATRGWTDATSSLYNMTPNPNPGFAVYAPLPPDVSEVEVRSALLSEPLKVAVDRGVEQVPPGSADVPIVGRSALGDSFDASHTDPLIVTIHGVRRVDRGTVLYYSAVFPEGVTPLPFLSWGGNSNLFRSDIGLFPFSQSFGLVDWSQMRALTQAGGSTAHQQRCSDTDFGRVASPVARVCWVLFPGLDPATKQVDVLVGGKGLVQSVAVTDGAMTPTASTSVPDLGDGWPAIPATAFSQLTAQAVSAATTTLRNVVTEGAVTQSGQQVDLDTKVLFDYNRATLTSAGQSALMLAVTKLTSFNKPGAVTVTGHTDSDGDAAANLDLSKRRAQAVADALAAQLGSGYSFTVKGKGEADPIASNDTDAGKALNRRVTILPPE